MIAVKEGNENSEKTQALVNVLKSDEIRTFITDTYNGAVIPFDEAADEEVETEAAETEAAEAETEAVTE